MTTADKREVIADQLKDTPDKSNRAIAAMFGCSHHTVSSVRDELESTGQIAQLDRTEGKDGKSRPATKTKPEPEDEHLVEKPTGFSFEDDTEEVQAIKGTQWG